MHARSLAETFSDEKGQNGASEACCHGRNAWPVSPIAQKFLRLVTGLGMTPRKGAPPGPASWLLTAPRFQTPGFSLRVARRRLAAEGRILGLGQSICDESRAKSSDLESVYGVAFLATNQSTLVAIPEPRPHTDRSVALRVRLHILAPLTNR